MERGMAAMLTANDVFNLGVATLLLSLAPLLIGSGILSRPRHISTFVIGFGTGVATCGVTIILGYIIMR